MKKQQRKQKIGMIMFIVFICVVSAAFVFLNFSYLRDMFHVFVRQLFSMVLYAAIPIIPAVLLRAKFKERAIKGIALTATVLGGLCCLIHILLPETILDYHELIFVLTQNLLISSVPALYCIAFVGKGRAILAALAPSLMFFLSLFIRYVIVNDVIDTVAFILDESIFMLMLLSLVFAIWALLLIFISLMFYMFINRIKTKKELQKNGNRLK